MKILIGAIKIEHENCSIIAHEIRNDRESIKKILEERWIDYLYLDENEDIMNEDDIIEDLIEEGLWEQPDDEYGLTLRIIDTDIDIL